MSSNLWAAYGLSGWVLRWTPEGLDGSSDVLAAVVAELSASPTILATPTGPLLRATESDPLAVRVALARVRQDVDYLVGDVPRLPEAPEGATA